MVEMELQALLFQPQAWIQISPSRKRESGVENVQVVSEKTIVANVHHVEMTKVIKSVNSVVVSV